MKKIIVAFAAATLLSLGLLAPVQAQQTTSAVAVASCGTTSNNPVAGTAYPLTMNLNFQLCDTGGGGGGSAPSATVGSANPTTVSPVSGKNPAGNAAPVAVGTNGGAVAAQTAPASAFYTVTANTVTNGPTADATGLRQGLRFQVETSPTANIYICEAGQTFCSATFHDLMIPSGATVGTAYIENFPVPGAIKLFSTVTFSSLLISTFTVQ